jgi:hypothetical protein
MAVLFKTKEFLRTANTVSTMVDQRKSATEEGLQEGT